MKAFSLVLGLGSLLTASASYAKPAVYEIDDAHTKVGFEVAHLVVSTVEGRFNTFSGKFSFDPADFTKTTLEASADTASIDTGNQKRDEHLRSADFFDAGKNPKLNFKSKKAVKTGASTFKLTGDLTLKNVTREVTFDVTYGGAVAAMGKNMAGFRAVTEINRKDFGLSWSQMAETVPVVGDKVTLIINAKGFQVEQK